LDCADHSPLGSGALSTTGFPIDRALTARLLGFSGLIEVGYDGVSIRDDLHEAMAAVAILMTGDLPCRHGSAELEHNGVWIR
jgi:argininosuccinate lyase